MVTDKIYVFEETIMRNKLFLILLSTLILVVCASAPPLVETVIKKHDFPELDTIATAELGDTMVSHLYSATSPSYKLLKSWSTAAYGGHVLAVGHVLRPRYEDKKYEGFFELGLCRLKESGAWCIGQNAFGTCNALTCGPNFMGPKEGDLDVVRADYVDVTQPNLQQELIYNGKVGNSVKFLYRELSQNMMRDAFSQDIQYDLSEGNEIGFKGVRLQIIEATNRKIKFKVSAHFIQ